MYFARPAVSLTFVAVLAFLIAFFSATQDITINAYPADILDENNWMLSRVFRAATDAGAKVVYVSSSMVFERAGEWPTPEEA